MKRNSSKSAASTRELIRTEAERLIARKGVYGFTLRDITDELEVQVPAIYKHYKSRDDVLLEVTQEFVARLSKQFTYKISDAKQQPIRTLRRVLDEFVDFHVSNPAYVNLSLTDFATPPRGLGTVRATIGSTLKANISDGPLAGMHSRLRALLVAGKQAGHFRSVSEPEFYAVVKGATFLRLLFPHALLGPSPPRAGAIRRVKNTVWRVACGFLTNETISSD